MGVERVEDTSRVQGSALLGSKGQRPLVFLNQHAEEVCKCAQLNREMGVERVEDPSRVQGSALPESRGSASGGG